MELPKYFYFRVRPKDMGTAVDLEDASDADVVEVVRCKDCKYGLMLTDVNGLHILLCGSPFAHGIAVDNYGFCKWGERREDVRKAD